MNGTALIERPAADVEGVEEAPATQLDYKELARASFERKVKMLEYALSKAPQTFGCGCPACMGKGLPLAPARYMPLPAPEALSDALLATAAFCLDPESPKVMRRLAVRADDGMECEPCDEGAGRWCAIGFLGKQLGINDSTALIATIAAVYHVPMDRVWQDFDGGNPARAAATCQLAASVIGNAK